ncbi:class I SAM-dependent methyltransferase, partial [Aspergillus homomorphus CBS 101889]
MNEQQLFWRFQTGHVLSPLIPRQPGMRVADLGCGTGIWCIDLGYELDTAEICGYDISDALYPPQSTLPKNVKLDTLDVMSDIPDKFHGAFDVVHLRLWVCVVRDNRPDKLIQAVSTLLKPGGYVQWEEIGRDTSLVSSCPMQRLESLYTRQLESERIDSRWVGNLPDIFREQGFSIMQGELGMWEKTVRGLYYANYLTVVTRVLRASWVNSKEDSTYLENL